MRIQHNIMAMNAYRNYNNNTSALSKNLEKLSSGYKINRAGDDAAGLAISEKMRAQITGLEAAQKNVKDGISLVKTGEGAMQEIQDMLNRMDYLATQSANGTYDNEVDRANLQKEVTALKDEINRIADSANFNGIKLLDGSLSASGGAGGAAGAPVVGGLETTTTDATKFTVDSAAPTAITANLTDGAELTMTVNYTDASGAAKSEKLTLTYVDDGAKGKLVTAGGTEVVIAGTAGQPNAKELGSAFAAAIKENGALSDTFKVSADATTGKLTFTAKEGGAATSVGSITENWTATAVNQADKAQTLGTATKGADAYESFDFAGGDYSVGDVFTVNGQKFAFVNSEADAAKLGSNVNCVKVATADTIVANDVNEMVKVLKGKTGAMGIEADAGTATQINFKSSTAAGAAGSGGLTLQIGDTPDDYNQMKVVIGDMHTKALGIEGLDISTQDGAKGAIDTIRNAINQVSSVRGDLGAVQNRLEHTQNNLSVMTENIQDAESTIRDTDVAEEMMSYVKNNILVQSAQAMLAQANQVPQGVLQLLG